MTTNTTFSPTITTDVLIIGFGKGGKTLATKLSATGHKAVSYTHLTLPTKA